MITLVYLYALYRLNNIWGTQTVYLYLYLCLLFSISWDGQSPMRVSCKALLRSTLCSKMKVFELFKSEAEHSSVQPILPCQEVSADLRIRHLPVQQHHVPDTPLLSNPTSTAPLRPCLWSHKEKCYSTPGLTIYPRHNRTSRPGNSLDSPSAPWRLIRNREGIGM